MLITFVMLATIAANLSVGSTFPSWYPSAHAIPALVVATAFAPASSKIRALPASQTFGRMSRLGSWWSLRNVVTKFSIIIIFLLLVEYFVWCEKWPNETEISCAGRGRASQQEK